MLRRLRFPPALLRADKLLAAATEYEARGYEPLLVHGIQEERCTCPKPGCSHPGKHPVANGWNRQREDTPARERAIRSNPNLNLGLRTGAGLIVLDIDPRHGG